MSYLFFDTETTGFPVKGAPWSDERQPHLVQIAAILYDKDFNEVENVSEIIYPEAFISGHEQSWIIPESAAKIHRIKQARAV